MYVRCSKTREEGNFQLTRKTVFTLRATTAAAAAATALQPMSSAAAARDGHIPSRPEEEREGGGSGGGHEEQEDGSSRSGDAHFVGRDSTAQHRKGGGIGVDEVSEWACI